MSVRRSRAGDRRADVPVLLMAIVAVAYPIVTLAGGTAPGEVWLLAAALVLQAGALAVRGRAPVAALAATSLLDFALVAVSHAEFGVGSLAVMFAAYTLRRSRPPRAGYPVLAVAGAVSAAVAALALATGTLRLGGWLVPVGLFRAMIGYGLPAFVAEIVTARQRFTAALRERAELAEAAREHAAADAIRQERSLMARELHDIAAHHLTGIVVSVQAAGALVATKPDTARDYLAAVEREARTTLDNLRQAVGLLHPDGATELAPAPALRRVPELVAAIPGTEIELSIHGEPVLLGPLAEIAAYRMVQESLTNAAKHAPGAACRVGIEYTATGARITVENAAPAAGRRSVGIPAGGHGLAGMRERATLLGGSLQTIPTAAGGWRNTLRLPLPDTVPADRGTVAETVLEAS